MFFNKRKKYLDRKFSEIANLDDIYGCFRLILGRAPVKTEWPGHSQLAGRPLKDVVKTYISSKEFKERHTDYVDVSEIVHVELPGFNMWVPKNDPQVGVHLYEHKNYDTHITNLIRHYLPVGGTFLDLGANIGYFSSLASSIVGQKGYVVAVEPGASNARFLMLNKQLNKFDQLEIFPVAATDSRDIWLYDSAGSNGFIGKTINENDLNRVFGSQVVQSMSVDDICHSVTRVDMMKVDIEGAEYLALKGARKTIKTFQPMIISEFSPPALGIISKVTPEKFLSEVLDETEYEIFCLLEYELIPCGRDTEKVIQQFNATDGDHIDILFAKPSVIT